MLYKGVIIGSTSERRITSFVFFRFGCFPSVPLDDQVVRRTSLLMLLQICSKHAKILVLEEDTIHSIGGADTEPIWVINVSLVQNIMNGFKSA